MVSQVSHKPHCYIILKELDRKNNRLPLPNLLSPGPGYSFRGLFNFSREKIRNSVSNVVLLNRYG